MSAYEKIKQGLFEAIEHEQGKGNARCTRVTLTPVKEYNATEIKRFRLANGMTQRVFANFMGVSLKTVEAWEAGRNKPSGAAGRLLSYAQSNPQIISDNVKIS